MYRRNPFVCLAIVVMLGVAALVSIVGIILIAMAGQPVPSSLVAISSSAVGAIAGALAMAPNIMTVPHPPEKLP